MYNHKIKEVKFSFFKSNFIKKSLKKENAWVLFLKNNTKFDKGSSIQLKKSFFFKNFSKSFLDKNSIAGGGFIFKKVFDLEHSYNDFFSFIEKKSCIIVYKSIYWTLSKILMLNIKENNINKLTGLLLGNLKKTLSFLLPLKSLISSLKLESSKKDL